MKATLKVHYMTEDGSKRFQEPVEVEFRELSAAEVPLAFESEISVTRWFEGRHFRRYTLRLPSFRDPNDGSRDAVAIITFLQNAKRPSALGYMGLALPEGSGPKNGYLTVGYFNDHSMSADRKFAETRHPRYINDGNRHEAIEGARRFAKDCLIVDGHFWVACAEPKLVVSRDLIYIDTRHRTRPLLKPEDKFFHRHINMNEVPLDLQLLQNTYSLNEIEDVYQIADGFAFTPTMPSFVIHNPESLTWDRRTASLISSGQLLLAEWDGRLEVIPPDISLALSKISGCMLGKQPDDVNLDRLADGLEDAVAAYRANGLDIDVVARVCDDWHNRPIDMALYSPSLRSWA